MTSLAQSEDALPHVRGLAFLGFPLHAVGKDSDARGEHLQEVDVPLLFISGTRDKMANAELLQGVINRLSAPTTFHPVEDGDHGFHVRKKSGRSDDDAIREICDTVAEWCHEVCAS